MDKRAANIAFMKERDPPKGTRFSPYGEQNAAAAAELQAKASAISLAVEDASFERNMEDAAKANEEQATAFAAANATGAKVIDDLKLDAADKASDAADSAVAGAPPEATEPPES